MTPASLRAQRVRYVAEGGSLRCVCRCEAPTTVPCGERVSPSPLILGINLRFCCHRIQIGRCLRLLHDIDVDGMSLRELEIFPNARQRCKILADPDDKTSSEHEYV